MEQPKFKASKEIRFLDEAYKTTERFVAQLKIDKKDPMFVHAKMVMDDKAFKKEIIKTIKKDKVAAEVAVKTVADAKAKEYLDDNSDMMSDGATFDGEALVKEIKARKKLETPSTKEKQIEVATYLSNPLKPIDSETDLIVNTNKLFLEKNPTVSAQVKVYKKILETNPNYNASFVLLNIDAIIEPKWIESITKKYGHNSLLIKGIRLGYIDQDIMINQIKALIKASQYTQKTVTILLPMVSTNEEYLVLQNAVKTLYKKEKGLKGNIETSVLLETPSMVMEPDVVLNNTDRVVLDLDSLVQYTLGIEKDNHLFSHLNQPLNSAVLRQVRNLIMEAKRLNKEVWIQGRSVNEPEVLCALIGIGAKHLVVSRYNVEQTQQLITKLDVPATYELIANNVRNTIADDTQTAIEEYLDSIE